jgi:hypothetical protein
MKRIISILLLCSVALWGAPIQQMQIAAIKKQAAGGASTLLTGLESYWTLDEASGTRADSHGSNDLTDTNGVGSDTGKIDDAALFVLAETTKTLSCADNASLSLGADSDFTICAWVRRDESVVFPFPIVAKTDSIFVAPGNGNEYTLWIENNLAFYFQFAVGNGSSSATVNATSFGAVGTGTWNFVVCWHDSAANKIYIQVNNGTADEAAWSGGTQDGSNALGIGVQSPSSPGSRFGGAIDEVGFWKRVLTSDERTELYNAGTGISHPF